MPLPETVASHRQSIKHPYVFTSMTTPTGSRFRRQFHAGTTFPLEPTPIRVSDEVLDDLRRRLTAAKWPLDAGNDEARADYFALAQGHGWSLAHRAPVPGSRILKNVVPGAEPGYLAA